MNPSWHCRRTAIFWESDVPLVAYAHGPTRFTALFHPRSDLKCYILNRPALVRPAIILFMTGDSWFIAAVVGMAVLTVVMTALIVFSR